MTRRLATFTLIAAATTLWAHTASAKVITWKIDGDTRRAIVYTPSADSAGNKAPLILSFHGHGDNV